MNIDDLRREAIRCRNLGNRKGQGTDADWYRDRGIRLAKAVEVMVADIAAEPEITLP